MVEYESEILESFNSASRVEILEVKPGDVIVFNHPKVISEQAIAFIRRCAEELFPNNKCIILEEGMRIGIARMTDDNADNSGCGENNR